jgi:hypothetical protein
MRPRSISFLTTFCAAPPLRLGGSIAQWSSRCEAADRTIQWVSVSLVADMVGILRCCGATPRAVTTAAPLRHRAGGAGSRTSVTPGRRHYRSVRSRMPVLSATIFDAVFVRAGFGTCRLGLITVWLPVRVLPAPPRSRALTPSSPSPRNTLHFSAVHPALLNILADPPIPRPPTARTPDPSPWLGSWLFRGNFLKA